MSVRYWNLVLAAAVSALLAITQSPQSLGSLFSRGSSRPLATATQVAGQAAGKLDVRLPLRNNSVRFAVIGDSGTGDRDQYEVAREMEAYREATKFDFVIMLGDNIYGSHAPGDFVRKFEEPYKPLLDSGVKFYASLGNHDDPKVETLYKPFNMDGERYYAFRKDNVAFFALDSTYMDPKQLEWFEQNLKNSQGAWKICFFHHPLYNDGRHHGSDLDLRKQLLPLFQKYGVNVVFSGHEHVYERMKLQNNINYFVEGSSGKLMTHDFRNAGERVKGYDKDRGFMIVEVDGDQLYFQTLTRTGETIDSGELTRTSTAQHQASQTQP